MVVAINMDVCFLISIRKVDKKQFIVILDKRENTFMVFFQDSVNCSTLS